MGSVLALRRAATAALLSLLLVLSGCGDGPASTSADTLQRARDAGKIRIGYANEAPFAYLDQATGELAGEAPAIAREVLAELGIGEIEGVLTEFGSLIPGLQAGRFDVIAAGMYVLPARCLEVAFSEPTYSVGEAFAVAAGNPRRLHSYADVGSDSDARVGVVAGAVQLQYALASGVPRDRIVIFPDAPSALEGLIAGRVDAYAGTALTVNDLLNRAGKAPIERADPFDDLVIETATIRGYGAFGFRKRDEELLHAFNGALRRLIGSPAHAELVRPYGFTEHELPGEVTTEELCRG